MHYIAMVTYIEVDLIFSSRVLPEALNSFQVLRIVLTSYSRPLITALAY